MFLFLWVMWARPSLRQILGWNCKSQPRLATRGGRQERKCKIKHNSHSRPDHISLGMMNFNDWSFKYKNVKIVSHQVESRTPKNNYLLMTCQNSNDLMIIHNDFNFSVGILIEIVVLLIIEMTTAS